MRRVLVWELRPARWFRRPSTLACSCSLADARRRAVVAADRTVTDARENKAYIGGLTIIDVIDY
jgi:hypothetical protein